MIRDTLVLLIFAGLAALAGAQSGKPVLTGSQQQQLFHRNRAMVEALVDSGVEISKQSNEYTERSRSYRDLAMKFQSELNQAADNNDAARVAELGKHLNTVLLEGLAPSLRNAHRQIGADGTGREKLLDIRNSTVELVDWLQNRARNKWADTPEVREVIDSLETTKKELGSSVGP
jgi:hypothetical protein